MRGGHDGFEQCVWVCAWLTACRMLMNLGGRYSGRPRARETIVGSRTCGEGSRRGRESRYARRWPRSGSLAALAVGPAPRE